MHHHSLDAWQVSHDYIPDSRHAERRTLQVVTLTAVMMVIEIGAGMFFGSMALLADGWHMASHTAALGITLFAYAYVRRCKGDPRFSFGPGKVSSLGGFASAIALACVALLMAVESLQRLWAPTVIHFDEALLVATVGLAVNLASAWLLARAGVEHHHHHEHGHAHHEHGGGHAHHAHDQGGGHAHHGDNNLRAAYLHVLADALTSLMAIGALIGGKLMGWHWLDPVIGLVGAAVIGKWCVGLLRDTSRVLLDSVPDREAERAIREAVEGDGDSQVVDLHVWELLEGRRAAIVSVVAHRPRPPEDYKERIAEIRGLVHITVEVNPCGAAACQPASRAS